MASRLTPNAASSAITRAAPLPPTQIAASTGQQVWALDPPPAGADGWSQVYLDNGTKGLVPEQYVQWSPRHKRFGAGGGGAFSATDPYGEEDAALLGLAGDHALGDLDDDDIAVGDEAGGGTLHAQGWCGTRGRAWVRGSLVG